MEHVQHVESVSCTIAEFLGLNVDLTRAIAMGHDLGHAPFGHEGEVELTNICKENNLSDFWHEKNSLRIIDKIELLEDNKKNFRNLNLTYAVRDGIIAHCGEIKENGIFPREDAIDLDLWSRPGQYQPYTWEGCVVKMADKIAYLGRDIEDAMRMYFIDRKELKKLWAISKKYGEETVNTTVIIHNFITSICKNSSPDAGIRLGKEYNNMLKEIMDFNYATIYKNEKFSVYRNYAALVIRSIYDTLSKAYDRSNTVNNLLKMHRNYPTLIKDFVRHINQLSTLVPDDKKIANSMKRYKNIKIYGNLDTKEIYV